MSSIEFDALDTTDESAGTDVQMPDVTGDPECTPEGDPIMFRIAGTYSSQYKAATKKIRESNTRLFKRGKEIDDATIEANAYAVEAACILAWPLTNGGQPFPITAENWKAVAAKKPHWREKVITSIPDHARFFVKS